MAAGQGSPRFKLARRHSSSSLKPGAKAAPLSTSARPQDSGSALPALRSQPPETASPQTICQIFLSSALSLPPPFLSFYLSSLSPLPISPLPVRCVSRAATQLVPSRSSPPPFPLSSLAPVRPCSTRSACLVAILCPNPRPIIPERSLFDAFYPFVSGLDRPAAVCSQISGAGALPFPASVVLSTASSMRAAVI